jgi:hypothetical protein
MEMEVQDCVRCVRLDAQLALILLELPAAPAKQSQGSTISITTMRAIPHALIQLAEPVNMALYPPISARLAKPPARPVREVTPTTA